MYLYPGILVWMERAIPCGISQKGFRHQNKGIGVQKVFHLLIIPAKLELSLIKTPVRTWPMEFKDHPLWHFTVKAHQQTGVHEACVDLQKNQGIDVNFLFWCCWLAEMGAPPLDEAQLQSAMDAVGPWQRDIVRPVWRARWKLKPSYGNFPEDLTEALRQQLITAEINAEHIEMLQLADVVKIPMEKTVSTWERASHAMENMKRYLMQHFIEENEEKGFPESILPSLNTILCACFPGLKKSKMLDTLKEQLKKPNGDISGYD